MKKGLIALFIVSVVAIAATQIPVKKKVLIIGDSISLGYTPYVKNTLVDFAEVVHNKGNAQHTATGKKKIQEWLGDTKWDVITFNWGLWDLCYRHPESKVQGKRDKVNGIIAFSVEEYTANMDTIVSVLKKTGAKLLFINTTVVPANEAGRFEGDDAIYNQAAEGIMKKNNIPILDLHTASIAIHQEHAKGDGDVHYTEDGYKALSVVVVNEIRALLK